MRENAFKSDICFHHINRTFGTLFANMYYVALYSSRSSVGRLFVPQSNITSSNFCNFNELIWNLSVEKNDVIKNGPRGPVMPRDTSSSDKGVCFCPVTYNCVKYCEGVLPKGSYLPCVSMAGRALSAGYPRFVLYGTKGKSPCILLCRHCAMASQTPGNSIVQHPASYSG